MSHITLPTRPDPLPAIPADAFDSVELACQQAGHAPARPYSGLGLHFDYTLKGRLLLAAFVALFSVYSWLTGMRRAFSRLRG